jgi:PII-like signaling protein
MTIEGDGLLVRIYIGESDHHDGKPAYDAIVRLLRERGIRGASVFRGIEGFGRSSRVHTTRILAMSEDLPILIEAVDEASRIRAVLPDLETMVGGGLVTLERVEVVVYRAGQ